MEEQNQTEADGKITLSLAQYEHLLQQTAKSRPGIVSELRGILADAYRRLNKHFVFTCLVTWEVLFYDKHAKDQTPDSIIELIQQLLTAAGNA